MKNTVHITFVLWVVFSLFLTSIRVHAFVILQYQHVSDKTPRDTSISPRMFEQHLVYLKENNVNVMSLLDVSTQLKSGKKLSDRAVAITFDEGYASIFNEAWPLLKKYNMPFAVFVHTQAHDKKNHSYMSWSDLKALSRSGVVIANHSDSLGHMIRRRNGESLESFSRRRSAEIDFAQKRIKQELGSAHLLFSYPFGEHDRELRAILSKKGYVAFGRQEGPIPDSVDLSNIPRFSFKGFKHDMNDFALKVNSVTIPLASVRVEGANGRQEDDMELSKDSYFPIVEISSPVMPYIGVFSCYAQGKSMIKAKKQGQKLRIQTKSPLPVGRSAYRCLSATGDGRYYWWSQPFVRRDSEGQWSHN